MTAPDDALAAIEARALMSAAEARGLLSAMTPGTLEVSEIRDGRLIDAAPQELAVVIHDDARAHLKPDGTWHSVIVCRGMDGPTREANAAALASVKRALATVAALGAQPVPADLAAIEARAAAATEASAEPERDFGRNDVVSKRVAVAVAASAADVPALLAALRSLRAHVASEPDRVAAAVAAATMAARGTLATPTLAAMQTLHRLGGCWLVSYGDDATGDPVTTIEYLDGARALAEKEGDNPVRWVAIDRCGRACALPCADTIAATGGR